MMLRQGTLVGYSLRFKESTWDGQSDFMGELDGPPVISFPHTLTSGKPLWSSSDWKCTEIVTKLSTLGVTSAAWRGASLVKKKKKSLPNCLDADEGGDDCYVIQDRRSGADSSALGVRGGRGNEDIFQGRHCSRTVSGSIDLQFGRMPEQSERESTFQSLCCPEKCSCRGGGLCWDYYLTKDKRRHKHWCMLT